jgi:hypothetical protein
MIVLVFRPAHIDAAFLRPALATPLQYRSRITAEDRDVRVAQFEQTNQPTLAASDALHHRAGRWNA